MGLVIFAINCLTHLQKIVMIQRVFNIVERCAACCKIPRHGYRLLFINIADLLLSMFCEVYFGERLLTMLFLWS